MKRGLVLEGGAMRGLFSAGVMDVMMESGLEPDGIVGVSAGAAFGCNYKSGQAGRAIRYNKRFARDSRYSGMKSLIKSGDIFNAEFAYHIVPTEYDIFDCRRFAESDIDFYVICTDVISGKPVYHLCRETSHELFEWIRASASMPVVSNVVEINDMKLLDGGMTDSIPLEFFERTGYDRNIVILTQPRGYLKMKSKALPLIRLALRKYPAVYQAMACRHEMYNRQIEYIDQAEREGRCMVIRPESPLKIGHISHNPADMQQVYDEGRRIAIRMIDRIKQFWLQS